MISGSGGTETLMPLVKKAKSMGAQVAVISMKSKSPMAELADLVCPIGSGNENSFGIVHGMLNLTATGLYAASLVLRKRDKRQAGIASGLMGYAISSVSAYLGGMLVYEQRVGVQRGGRDSLAGFSRDAAEVEAPRDRGTSLEPTATRHIPSTD